MEGFRERISEESERPAVEVLTEGVDAIVVEALACERSLEHRRSPQPEEPQQLREPLLRAGQGRGR